MSSPDNSIVPSGITPSGAAQSRPFRAFVESYLLNDLDTTIHPSYDALQQTAQIVSGRPQAGSYWSAPQIALLDDSDIATAEDVSDGETPLEELYRDAEAESKRFKKAMNEYEKTAYGTDTSKRPLISKSEQTWEEVLRVLDRATVEYNEPQGAWGRIRTCLRKTSEKAEPAAAWLNLFPTQSEYFSIVCGGLKLIFGAAARLRELRDEVAEAVIQIPTLLSCTNKILNVHKRAPELHNCSSDLFVAVIALIRQILDYYVEKGKLFKAVFKQGEHGRKISDKIRFLKFRSDQFIRVADACNHEAIDQTRLAVHGLNRDLRHSHKQTNAHLHVARLENHDQFRILGSRFDGLEGVIRDQLDIVLSKYIGDFAAFLASNSMLNPRTQDLRGPMLPPLRKAASESALRERQEPVQERCLDLLRYEPSANQADVNRIVRGVYILPQPSQDRVIHIIRHERYRNWLMQRESSVLFLNGNNLKSEPARRSPTAFVCAKLVSSIQAAKSEADSSISGAPLNTFVISYFCTEHMDMRDPKCGAIDIMQSLLAQLLTSYRGFKHETISKLQDCNLEDLNTLCYYFQVLLGQFSPGSILFCIIDAITLHEDSKTREESVSMLIDHLITLTEADQCHNMVLKILLTSPRVSRLFQRKFDWEDILTMPEKVEPQGGFTHTKWNNYIGR